MKHGAIRNVTELGFDEVCKVQKRMMRKPLAEIIEFVAADKRERAGR